MIKYEVCSVTIKFSQNQSLMEYRDYKLGMVYDSGAPWDLEEQYTSLEAAEKDFSERRSEVICKGGKLFITEYFLQKIEFAGYDEEGYAKPPVSNTFLEIAPIGDKELADKLIEVWSSNRSTDTLSY